MCLTQDTSNALHLTLDGIVSMIKLLLSKDLTTFFQEAFKVIDWRIRNLLSVCRWMLLYFGITNYEKSSPAEIKIV